MKKITLLIDDTKDGDALIVMLELAKQAGIAILGIKEEKEKIPEPLPEGMRNHYFTFGTGYTQPLRKGWVRIIAKDWDDACNKFIRHFAPIGMREGCINCAGMYDEENFKQTIMYTDSNLGETEHFCIK